MGHAVVFIISYISYIFIIVLAGKTWRRKRFTSSSHFSLNQLKPPEGIKQTSTWRRQGSTSRQSFRPVAQITAYYNASQRNNGKIPLRACNKSSELSVIMSETFLHTAFNWEDASVGWVCSSPPLSLCFLATRTCSLLVNSMQGCRGVKWDLSHHYKK